MWRGHKNPKPLILGLSLLVIQINLEAKHFTQQRKFNSHDDALIQHDQIAIDSAMTIN